MLLWQYSKHEHESWLQGFHSKPRAEHHETTSLRRRRQTRGSSCGLRGSEPWMKQRCRSRASCWCPHSHSSTYETEQSTFRWLGIFPPWMGALRGFDQVYGADSMDNLDTVVWAHAHTHTHIFVCTHVRAHTLTCTHTNTHTHTHTHSQKDCQTGINVQAL